MVTAAVLAGGSGLRMGNSIPKQFLTVGGKPLIVHTLNRFYTSDRIQKIYVAVSDCYIEYTENLINRYFTDTEKFRVVSGGKTRSDTLLQVLKAMDAGNASEADIVLTHDAVRPFIDERIIDENIAAASENGACNTCVPAVDTVFISKDGEFIDSVPPRSTVFHAQTPQSFRVKELYTLCMGLPADVFENMTDGCSVYAYYGKKVSLVQGKTDNIKITFPSDIDRAEMILRGE